jgi:UPF0716 family protein affecting phage T7 exclusion
MSTGLIVAIVIVALIILALLFLLPRMRQAARHKQAQRELHSRREAVATEHRQEAAQRETRAEEAERKARMAEQAAQRERAEANLRHERADMHERGMADDELIEDHERDRFAGVAGPDETADADRDDVAESPGVRSGTTDDTGATGTQSEYGRGREDERRFERNRVTDDVRESDRPRNS